MMRWQWQDIDRVGTPHPFVSGGEGRGSGGGVRDESERTEVQRESPVTEAVRQVDGWKENGGTGPRLAHRRAPYRPAPSGLLEFISTPQTKTYPQEFVLYGI